MIRQISEKFLNKIEVQNYNFNLVQIEKTLAVREKNNKYNKNNSYSVQLPNSILIISKENKFPISDIYTKQMLDELCQINEGQSKTSYHILLSEDVLSEEPLLISKNIVTKINRGGELGKASNPGTRARAKAVNVAKNKAKARKAKAIESKAIESKAIESKTVESTSGKNIFTEAWGTNSFKCSRPRAGNHLAQQLQSSEAKSGTGFFSRFFGRFFGQSTPRFESGNQGCVPGPRSIIILNQSKSSEQETPKELKTYDGVRVTLEDRSLNHFTSKHGNKFGVMDPLPVNPNQKPTKFEQTRTRINKENKRKVYNKIKKILSNRETTNVYPNVKIRGINGRIYHCTVTDIVIAIHTEGQFAGQIMKAQPISDKQLEFLRKLHILD